MKVSAGEHVALAVHRFRILHEHQRVVDRRVRLDLKHRAAMGERVAHRAMHLWDAAQRIGVLHAAAVAMRLTDLALFEQTAQVRRSPDLSGMRASLLDAIVEGDIGSLEGIACHRADDVGGVDQRLRGEQHQNADGQHGLRAIDQRHRFFRFEQQGFNLRALQRFGAGDARAFFVKAFALTDQCQRQVRQGRKIAARSHASLRWDHRGHAAIEHLADGVDDDAAHA